MKSSRTQQLLDPVFLGSDVTDQRFTITGELPHVTDILVRYKTTAQESGAQQGCYPFGITQVGLFARNISHVSGIDYQQVHFVQQGLLQHSINRVPINPRAFHGYITAALFFQPLAQRMEIIQMSTEFPDLAFWFQLCANGTFQDASHDAFFVNIQSTTAFQNVFHMPTSYLICSRDCRDHSDFATRAGSSNRNNSLYLQAIGLRLQTG